MNKCVPLEYVLVKLLRSVIGPGELGGESDALKLTLSTCFLGGESDALTLKLFRMVNPSWGNFVGLVSFVPPWTCGLPGWAGQPDWQGRSVP